MPAATASFSPAAPPTKKSIPQELPVLTPDHPQTQEKPSAADGEGNETEEALIERLGRERPAIFKSRWADILLLFHISVPTYDCESTLTHPTHRDLAKV